METKLIGDCHHLECCDINSRYCLKRYFTVFNPNEFKHMRFGFCNDYLRLKLNQQKLDEQKEYERKYGNGEYAYFSYKSALEDFLETFLSQEFGQSTSKWSFSFRYSDKAFNDSPVIRMLICERPHIYACISLQQATEILIDIVEEKGYLSTYSEFFNAYRDAVQDELNKLLRYKKYKAQHKTCQTIINRFNRNGINKWCDGIGDLIELLTEIFKLNINKYESSK